MEFNFTDGILTIDCNMLVTTALAGIVLMIGLSLRKKVRFFRKYCIPAPVIGGLIFMLITWLGHQFGLFNMNFNTDLEGVFMIAFFSTVGLGADFGLIKKGGRLLLIYWALAGFIAVAQGFIALGVGGALGLDSPYSLLAGAISMSGGHGGAAAYGSTFASMGYDAAQDVGIAAATFGLITSVILGGPLARKLIVKNNLKSADSPIDVEEIKALKLGKTTPLSNDDICKNFAILLAVMALGSITSKAISSLVGMTIPEYLGAMLVSIIVRNLNTRLHFFVYSEGMFQRIGDASLDIFLGIAMMTIKLWELMGLVMGVAIIVIVQVTVMAFYAYFIAFKALGKTYDAAIMCAGLCGHGLGATPTAMANMESVRQEFGPSRKAFLIVPIVAAFLVELIYQPVTIFLVNTFVVPIG